MKKDDFLKGYLAGCISTAMTVIILFYFNAEEVEEPISFYENNNEIKFKGNTFLVDTIYHNGGIYYVKSGPFKNSDSVQYKVELESLKTDSVRVIYNVSGTTIP